MNREPWWKVGFFVALFAVEFLRETTVVWSDTPPTFGGAKLIANYGGDVTVQGRWQRSDGGDPLVPIFVKASCERAKSSCTETTVTTFGNTVMPPDEETFAATFSQSAVEYQKDYRCMRYLVRIDAELKRAEQTRLSKPSNDPLCKNREPRIEMVLGDGWQSQRDPLGDHFVPLLRVGAAIGTLL